MEVSADNLIIVVPADQTFDTCEFDAQYMPIPLFLVGPFVLLCPSIGYTES
jgi:hypothetical protein